jgi:hypothetical protein
MDSREYRCTFQSTPTSDGCAIGRKLSDDEREYCEGLGTVSSVDIDCLSYFAGWCKEFLLDVRGLHDRGEFWDVRGYRYADEVAAKYLRDLRERILRGEYEYCRRVLTKKTK